MSPKQQISAREFIQDTQSGMTDSELLEKYKLSPNRLQRILRGLIDGGIITIDELDGRHALFDDTAHGPQSVRLLFRHVVDYELHIYEDEKPEILGSVLDITEGGVGLKGIEARIGESKDFTIPANEFFDSDQVEFRARCRWVNKEESSGKCVGGFEITSISPGGLVELRKLVQSVELANQVEVIEYDEPLPEETDKRNELEVAEYYELSHEETDRREEPRYAVEFSLPVHEAIKRENKGIIVDVGEGGLGIKGLSAEPGETKTLIIPTYYHGRVTFHSIVMVAECRWTDIDGETGERRSGFKVLQITPRNAIELAKLVSTLRCSKS